MSSRHIQRVHSIGRAQHGIALLLQERFGKNPNTFLVFNHEDSFRPAASFSSNAGGGRCSDGWSIELRQKNFELGASAPLTFNQDVTMTLPHDAVGSRKSKAGS